MKTKELRSADGSCDRATKALRRLDSDLRCLFLRVVKRAERIRDLSGEFREFSRSELAIITDFRPTKFYSLLVVSGFFIYAIIKYLSLAVLYYKLDSISLKLWPTVDPKTNYSRCMSKHQYNSLITSNLDSYRKFIDLEADISRLKPVLHSIPGFNTMTFIVTCSVIFFYFFFGLAAVKLLKPKFYFYDLISNRQEERTRFQCEFNTLCESMFICSKLDNYNGKAVYEYRPRYSVKPTRQFPKIALEYGYEQFNEMNLKNADFAFRADRKLVHLIEPAHQADEVFNRVVAYINWNVLVRWLVLTLPIFGLMVFYLFLELSYRATYRLDMLQCQAIDGIPARAPIRLASIESNAYYVAAYKSYDETSPRSFLNLLLTEFIAILYFTPGVLLTMLELLLLLYVVSHIATSLFELYGYEFGSQLCWLNQIDKQVKQTICDLQGLIRESELKFPSVEVDRRRNDCLKSLSLAYMNFELFRRQQKEYQSLIGVLFAQQAYFAASVLFVSYHSCSNIKGAHTGISLVVATIVGGILNVYLISGSIRASKALKLMINISRIVALSASSCLKRSPIVNLWSNQILYRDETKQLFALRLLGIPISYDNILSLNANIIIMWYILKSN